jgi:ribulose-phosphate 3-epimerase
MSLVIPAVLPASRKDLEEKLTFFASLPSVSAVQIDVVDGRFATPASWPYSGKDEWQRMLAKDEMLPHLDRITYEIDLMCLDAESAAESWLSLGASRLTFHIETAVQVSQLLARVHKRFGSGPCASGIVHVGLAMNANTDIALIEPYLDRIDYVQFMGIARIGRQGQPFERSVLPKIRGFHARHPEVKIQVDGGVTLDVARELFALGVSNVVVGSAILHAPDPRSLLEEFEALENPFGV